MHRGGQSRRLSSGRRHAYSNAPRSIEELVTRRQDMKAMGEAMSKADADMRTTLANTEAKRAALQQPDDLKPVYTAAFERTIAAPAQAFMASVPIAIDVVRTSVALADYVDARRTTIKVSGSSILTNDNKARAEVTQMLNALNADNQRLAEARQRMRIAVDGK